MEHPDTQTKQQDEELNFLLFLGLIIDQKWILLLAVAISTLTAIFYSVLATPIYEANALLQVEEKTPSLPGLEDLSEAFGSESSTEAEIEIIRSRSVVGTAITNLSFTTDAEPLFFPIFGNFSHRLYEGSAERPIASAPLGLYGYAWGGEAIQISIFEVSTKLKNEDFVLTKLDGATYALSNDEFGIEVTGEVGVPLTMDNITLLVDEIKGLVGSRYLLTNNEWLETVQDVGEDLYVTEVGKQSGIIRIQYRHSDPDLAESMADEISQVYVRQNIRRLSAEAESSLIFLREQLPYVLTELKEAEKRFNDFASENQSIDVSVENEALLNQLVELDTLIQEVELNRVELNRRFTTSHPNVKAAEEQYGKLLAERARFNSKIESLPDTQQELFSLRRDVEVTNEMYQLLLYKTQEVEVVRASTVGNVRVIDPAIVDRNEPVAPQKALIVIIGVLVGMLLGVASVLIRRAIYRGVSTAESIETSGLSVFASIPHSAEQKRWDDQVNSGQKAHKGRGKLKILSEQEPTDLAIEMVRNLRTSLYFNLSEARNKAVMITGPSPGVGKSFVSVNLAVVCASAGQKVLLVDADLRRGYLHRYFNRKPTHGLSEYLSGQLSLMEAITATSVPGLDLITRGSTPPNPAELLHHSRLESLIAEIQHDYDLIIFDTPPVLAVTDALIVGQKTGNTLLVCRFEKSTTREIKHASERLLSSGSTVTGAVLNGVEKRVANYYGYGGYYGYGYGYSYASDTEK